MKLWFDRATGWQVANMELTMLYCTTNEDLLSVGSEVRQFDGTEAELTAKAQADFDGLKITGWEPASFGDCWRKLARAPEVDADGLAEFDGIKCRVSPPGTHPGGRAWWLTPEEAVFVPILREAD